MGDILNADIYEVLSDNNINWDSFKGCTVLVTGATGLIGSVLVNILSVANEMYCLNLRLIGHGRNKNKSNILAKKLNMEFINGDIRIPCTLIDVIDKVDYIFHCASITKSADMLEFPIDVILTAADGTRNILDLAQAKGCKSFVFLSSMEVYGQTKPGEVRENDLGYLDISNPRSSYPESKRFCEMLCIAYFTQYGLPVKIARLSRTFGAGSFYDESDLRVANQFARKAFKNEDIELHTQGNSIANNCYTADALRGLLTILLKGKNGEAYNIANPSVSVTIREMAEIVAKEVCDGKINVVVNVPEDIEKQGYAPDVGYILNVDKLMSLGWAPRFELASMYRRMLTDWKN